MTASYRLIDYRLRPAKHIERKMICEALHRMAEFATLESYRYVGFGSIYFTDFSLFHKLFGMTDMISIEKDEESKERFEFNKPHDCVRVEYGHSNDILPKLVWDEIRSIVWLDYDGTVSSEILTDVHFCAAHLCEGSMLILSLNVEPDRSHEDDDLVAQLSSKVGQNKVPISLKPQDLKGWNLALTCRNIIFNELEDALKIRNAVRPIGQRMKFAQIFNFHYADGAKMLTVGGVFHTEGQEPHLAKCNFRGLFYYRDAAKSYKINVPKLTFHEKGYLDKNLPNKSNIDRVACGIPAEDIDSYTEVYRYFPAFAETDL